MSVELAASFAELLMGCYEIKQSHNLSRIFTFQKFASQRDGWRVEASPFGNICVPMRLCLPIFLSRGLRSWLATQCAWGSAVSAHIGYSNNLAHSFCFFESLVLPPFVSGVNPDPLMYFIFSLGPGSTLRPRQQALSSRAWPPAQLLSELPSLPSHSIPFALFPEISTSALSLHFTPLLIFIHCPSTAPTLDTSQGYTDLDIDLSHRTNTRSLATLRFTSSARSLRTITGVDCPLLNMALRVLSYPPKNNLGSLSLFF